MSDRLVVPLPGPLDHQDVVEDAVLAYHSAWQALVAACPAGAYAVGDGLVRARTGLPLAPFNTVWGVGHEVDADAVLAAVADMAGSALPWNLQLRPGYPPALDGSLEAAGLVPTGQVPFMLLTDPRAAAEAVATSSLDCRRTEVFADADSALRLLEEGFGLPTGLTRALLPLRMLFLPGATTWLAAYGGQDVSTAMRVHVGDTCGIFNVATPAQERGRGYGTLVTAQAVVDGFHAGASVAYLQASPLGTPVYQKLGFETVELWQQWMPGELLE